MSGAVTGLNLPLLRPGWIYQGWLFLETPALNLEPGKSSFPDLSGTVTRR